MLPLSHSVRMRFVELVTSGCELVLDHIAEVRKICQTLAQDLEDRDVVCG